GRSPGSPRCSSSRDSAIARWTRGRATRPATAWTRSRPRWRRRLRTVVVRTERPLAQVAAQCAAVAFVVVLASVPLYVWVEPSWRGLVARAASALVLGVALLQLRRLPPDRLEADGPWSLDEARRRPRSERAVPHHFRDLASDVRAALRSRRYLQQRM